MFQCGKVLSFLTILWGTSGSLKLKRVRTTVLGRFKGTHSNFWIASKFVLNIF